MFIDHLISVLMGPTYALPIDIFRILVGLLSFIFFLRTYLETGDFSNPNGLIDHVLSQDLYPATRFSFFQPGLSLVFFQIIFMLAGLVSWLLILGYWVKLAAAFLFVVAVSTYRWNFLVMHVDDAIMHLLLFWMLLLPIGHTLVLQEYLDNGASVEIWRTLTVPGTTMRLFLMNLSLLYLAAGLWKWTSPMWRAGTALYAVFKIAISRAPKFWRPSHLPLVKVANYVALVLEPLFPLMFLLPTNSWVKWMLFIGFLGFHFGIIATMKIPLANLAMVGATVIIFRNELMQFILNGAPPQLELHFRGQPGFSDLVALILVICLTLMVIWKAGSASGLFRPLSRINQIITGTHQNPMYGPLWAIGIAQSFRLFDWIDARNYHISFDILETTDDMRTHNIDTQELFPVSTRYVLLQSYLFGNIWRTIDPARLSDLRRTIFTRYARRYCKNHKDMGLIEVYATVQRVTSDNLSLSRGVRRLIMRFACRDCKPVLDYICLTPELFDRKIRKNYAELPERSLTQ